MTYEEKVNELADHNEESVVYHDIEDALIGIAHRFGMDPVAVYDYDRAIECLARGMEDLEDPYESAVEWFDYNTMGTWAGEGTPIFVKFFEQEVCEECHCKEKVEGWLTKTGTKIMGTLKSSGK